MNQPVSLNDRSWQLAQKALARSQELKIDHRTIGGAKVIDFGIDSVGGIEAGLLLSRICLAGLANVSMTRSSSCHLPSIAVRTDHPFLSCIASQYAGWELKVGEYFAMTSGPARCLRKTREPIIEALPVTEAAHQAVVVLESRKFPDQSVIQFIATECSVAASELIVCIAPTASFAGTTQIVARSVETTLHQLYELGFDLECVISGAGSAPLPPLGANDLESLGWTNDAILYGGAVTLWVDTEDAIVEEFGSKTPSECSNDYGTPFLELFKKYEYDFYKVDKSLFAPAQVTFNNVRTGNSMTFGKTRDDILRSSMRLQGGSS